MHLSIRKNCALVIYAGILASCSQWTNPVDSPIRIAAATVPAMSQAIHAAVANDGPDQTAAYNAALTRLIERLQANYQPAQMKGLLNVDGNKVMIDGGKEELKLLNPVKFDSIEIIRKAEGADQIAHVVTRDGLGVPVVMLQKYNAKKATGKKLFPLNGRHLPATVVADLGAHGEIVLRFHHTRNVEEISFGGRNRSLAYDLSTPLYRSMGETFMGNMALRGLIDSDRYLENTGIYLPDVYDPSKIPVVFVHGLVSDPQVWHNAINEVLRDPELRRKYQCWYFLYPTGLPVYASAEKLRRMLNVARDYYDPQHSNPQMKRMVLVGHSMGGLLSRMQAIDSGSDIYDSTFTKPLDQLNLKPLTKKLIADSMIFKRVPFVSRLVFVASPHQGSQVAEIPIIRTVGMLVNPTNLLDSVTMDVRLNAYNELNPELRKFKNFGCRSVQTLSPEHPLLKALKKRPIQVPCHSIIAAQDSSQNLWSTSDGVVAYWSSHVQQAKSELVVHGSHGCTRQADVSQEILRILRMHCKR